MTVASATPPSAPRVTVRLPGLLARFTDGDRSVTVRAATLEDCIDELLETHPAIEPHLLDGNGRLRRHIQLFHDGSSVEWGEREAVDLADGDEVLLLQAVSGG